MVETAIFSIFHRPPAEPADTAPDQAPPSTQMPAQATSAMLVGSATEPPTPNPPLEYSEPLAEHHEPTTDVFDPIVVTVDAAEQRDAPFDSPVSMSMTKADHALLGLANPDVFCVQASFAGVGAIDLTAERSGIYRPRSFRAAPWSGFAYDQEPDGLTGLAAGTRLLTARGEIPVEGLLPGDAVLALRGPALLPVTWVGRSAAAEPPIVIEQGALGPNRPRRALYLAPDHPVFIDPLPVPARQLVNGTTIRPTSGEQAELFHVDVGAAEVLFAEGIPLSSANRSGQPVQQ